MQAATAAIISWDAIGLPNPRLVGLEEVKSEGGDVQFSSLAKV